VLAIGVLIIVEGAISIKYPYNVKRKLATVARVLRIIAGAILVIIAMGGYSATISLW